MNFDSAELAAFVASQTTIINRQANETVFPEIVYPQLIPVVNEGNPFAQSVTFVSTTQAGRAGWIHGDADDVPMADAALAAEIKPIYTAGIGYGFGWEEIQVAQQLGYALDSLRAVAARRAYEQMVNRIAFDGDAEKGFKGVSDMSIWNASGLTLVNWSDFGGVSDQDVMTNINDLLMATANAGSVPTADTLLVPTAYFTALYSRYNPGSRESLLNYARQNNEYTAQTQRPLTIRAVAALNGSNGSTGNKVIAYRRAPDVLVLHMPMPHRFLPVYQAGPLRFEVPGVFRLGGLNVRRPEDTAEMHQ